jgi:ribulose kinase
MPGILLVAGAVSLAPLVSVGVDVGTGSARAGVVDVQTGALLAVRKQAIMTWSPLEEHHQQSSEDIWDACAACVRGALADAGDVQVAGIGFDATCSLVCLDENNQPVGTDPTAPEDDLRNIILWMDHRGSAAEEAGRSVPPSAAALTPLPRVPPRWRSDRAGGSDQRSWS